MDTTKAITHVSLCAGYGGIDLGLSRAIPSLRTVAFSEIEAFACANLVAKMEEGLLDAAPIWTNLKTFPWSEFRDRVDILSGGYPCQPFSAAGKRLGTEDPRHLWPYIADGIRAMRPRVCFFENVEGHISLGLREVIGELESIGYETAWGIFSASEVGAPHQRKRVFILAHSDRERGQLSDWWRESAEQVPVSNGQKRRAWPSRPGQPQHEWEPPRVVGNTIVHGHSASEISGGTSQSEDEGRLQESKRGSSSMGDTSDWSNGQQPTEQQGWSPSGRSSKEIEPMGNAHSSRPQERTGQRGAEIQGTHADGGETAKRQTQQPLGRNFNEPPSGMDYAELYTSCDNRTDELRLLGNGVVPATAERAFRTLLTELIP